jgi:tRNA dimethylallyltransferase
MYIEALMTGIAEIPEIPTDLRTHIRNHHAKVGNLAVYSELLEIDREVAEKLNVNDSHRILRAYEVIKATGKSIKYWQERQESKGILQNFRCEVKVVMPERSVLYENCNKRFVNMLNEGGINEVKALQSRELSPQIFSAIGIRQIMDYLNGDVPFQEMINDVQTKTRQYAKRQVTWFRRYI